MGLPNAYHQYIYKEEGMKAIEAISADKLKDDWAAKARAHSEVRTHKGTWSPCV